MLSRISSAISVHTKGAGLRLLMSNYARMACSNLALLR